MGAVGGKPQHFDGVLQRALAVFPQDLVGKDALEIIAVGERLSGDVVQEHIVQQHGDVVRPPRAKRTVVPAPVDEGLKRLGKQRRAFQLLRPYFGEPHDSAVHVGVELRPDKGLELPDCGKGLVQLYGADLNDLGVEGERVYDGVLLGQRLIPLKI